MAKGSARYGCIKVNKKRESTHEAAPNVAQLNPIELDDGRKLAVSETRRLGNGCHVVTAELHNSYNIIFGRCLPASLSVCLLGRQMGNYILMTYCKPNSNNRDHEAENHLSCERKPAALPRTASQLADRIHLPALVERTLPLLLPLQLQSPLQLQLQLQLPLPLQSAPLRKPGVAPALDPAGRQARKNAC